MPTHAGSFFNFIGASGCNSDNDDGIQGNSLVQLDGGTIGITKSEEGIEGNSILVNDGQITLYANDDGINAAQKSMAMYRSKSMPRHWPCNRTEARERRRNRRRALRSQSRRCRRCRGRN
ncbi:carbohydrate-binding domain-containing protein [Paenibacillus silvisoli]|uniref:carbohydrate-binding domain-containing protein n=1 Tax=Paenibacillus silvisoli TaxID=3110539 RepID=UPI0038991C18